MISESSVHLIGVILNILMTAVTLAVVFTAIFRLRNGGSVKWWFPLATGFIYLIFYLLEPSVASYSAFAEWYPDLYQKQDTYNVKDVIRSSAFLFLIAWLGMEVSRGSD